MAGGRQTTQAPPMGEARELKNYTLDEQIGQDELSTIFRGRHQTLDREVHIYLLRRSGWVAVSRFQLAARLAARFQHPHILPVLDGGHDDTYGYYMVTPPVAARTLQTMLEAGPIDPPDAIRIFAQIGQAVDFLHSAGVIHRDIQPPSILVCDDGRVLLTGLSLAWTTDGPDLSQLAEADYLTPYAAPEQTFEDRQPAPSLDLYALGAVLYHMLSGEVPPGPGAEPASVARTDRRMQGADRVIRRLLSPQPQHRYPTAAQAAAALRGALRPALGEGSGVPLGESGVDANYLENPLEIVLRDRIDPEFLRRAHERAEALHSGDGVRRLLDTWSAGQPQRRRQLGQVIRIDQIVSYNLYFYDLKVQYETRTVPQTRDQPYNGSKVSRTAPEPDRWQVPPQVETPAFADVAAVDVTMPNSERSITCPRCHGEGRVTCPRCQGQGTVDVKRMVKRPSGTQTAVDVVDCPDCVGAAKVTCERCEGSGGLLEQKVFAFSRRGRLWQNTDDLAGLPRRPIEGRTEQVFAGPIDVHDPMWYAVEPLHELFTEATRLEQDDTRVIAADLTIRAAPVTEVDYSLQGKPRTLAIIGFDSNVRGDLSLLDAERLLMAAAIVVIIVLLVIVFVLKTHGG